MFWVAYVELQINIARITAIYQRTIFPISKYQVLKALLFLALKNVSKNLWKNINLASL
jgi:hypothetical protein